MEKTIYKKLEERMDALAQRNEYTEVYALRLLAYTEQPQYFNLECVMMTKFYIRVIRKHIGDYAEYCVSLNSRPNDDCALTENVNVTSLGYIMARKLHTAYFLDKDLCKEYIRKNVRIIRSILSDVEMKIEENGDLLL